MEDICLRETANERTGILAVIDYSKENLKQKMYLDASTNNKGKNAEMGVSDLPKALR